MTPEQAKELLPIIQAFADGAAIECRGKYDEWGFVSDPTWRHTLEYRVKPKPDGSERVRKMLEMWPDECVLCGISDKSQEEADIDARLGINLGIAVSFSDDLFIEPMQHSAWRYASPVDLSQFAVEDLG